MKNSLPQAIARHLQKRGISDENEIYLYAFSFVGIMYCLISHILLLCLFVVNDIALYAYCNAVSVCIYCVALLCHRKKLYSVSMLMATLEVVTYGTIFVCFSGMDTFVIGYLLIVVMMHALVPYASDNVRMPIGMTVAAVSICVTVGSFYIEPRILLGEGLTAMLTIVNIVLLFTATITLLYTGQLIRMMMNRINRLKMNELSAQANTDPLTGLFNRRYADAVFTAGLNEKDGIRHCVAILDIDSFKDVNDTYGHACGDEVLVALAALIQDSLRPGDLVFRWGGEEILLLVKDIELSAAYTLLEKLRTHIADFVFETQSASVRLTATIGVAALNPGDIEGSMRTCDENLYIGKNLNKNTVVAR